MPSEDIPVIRDATPQDAERIAAIYNQAVASGNVTMDEHFWRAADVQSWMADLQPREGVLVLEDARGIVGWSRYLRYSPRAGYRFSAETATYLDKDRRGQGHGTRLKQATIERCRRLGYHHLVAKIAADNAVSLHYNRRLGYEVVGTQREIGYRNGQWVDMIILQCILSTPHPDHEASTHGQAPPTTHGHGSAAADGSDLPAPEPPDQMP